MKNTSGSVLVSVLAVSIILSILLISLFSSAAWAYNRGMGKLPRKQAHYTAMAGINTVASILRGENIYGDELTDDPDGVRTALLDFIKNGSDAELEIALNFGNDFGRCDLTVKNYPDPDEMGGEIEITSSVVIERMLDENAQLKEDEEYKISLSVGWAYDWDAYEDSLLDYVEYDLEELPQNPSVRADDYFWFIEDSASFAFEENENPLDYVSAGNDDALFLFINPGVPVNLGNIGWKPEFSFDVYVIVMGGADITGLEGLLDIFTDYDEDLSPEPLLESFPLEDEWYILHYKNPYNLGAGDAQFDDSLQKMDIFQLLPELGLDFRVLEFDDEDITYSKQ